MRHTGIAWIVLLATGAGLLAGCGGGKKVDILFRNTASRQFRLHVTTPDLEDSSLRTPRNLGVIKPDGGEVRVTISVHKDDLPTTVVWRAKNPRSSHKAEFRIRRDTPKRLLVLIPEGKVIPYDDHHDGRRKRKHDDDDD